MFIRNFAGKREKFIGLDAALKKSLAEGLALYSPDELTYLRVGDGQFNNYGEYIISSILLMKYRLFASYQKSDPLKESLVQIALAFLNVTYEFVKMAQEIIRIPLLCLKAVKNLLCLELGKFALSIAAIFIAAIKVLNQIIRAIPACILFVAGIVGIGTRAIVNLIPQEIGFFSNVKTASGEAIDAPSHFIPKIQSLLESQYQVQEDDKFNSASPEMFEKELEAFAILR